MTAAENTSDDRGERKIQCECGVTLDMRTQGLFCSPCRARNRSERDHSRAAAWERFHRRHSSPLRTFRPPEPSDAPNVDVESPLDSIDRLVRALEAGRFAPARPGPTTSRAQPTRPEIQPHGAGGLSVNHLEEE